MAVSPRIQALVDALNPAQRDAVLHRGGPLLLLAGAGTGKTRAITVRIAYYVATGLDPSSVLALTFTNKAAGEMGERLAGFVGSDAAKAMTVGTFHGLGLRLMEEEKARLGVRSISLLDSTDQGSAVRACLKQLKIDPRRHDPRVFLNAISNARNAGLTVDAMAAQPGRKLTAKVYQAYLDWLSAYRAFDFDDLILRPVQLLTEHDDLREKWQGRYDTVLVDEFQDTNASQLAMVRLLVGAHRELCVVGDDDQSIYGWRGATLANILQFEKHFPDATTIALTQNYRSTAHILEAANAVIGHNRVRRVKSLWTDGGEGERVQVIAAKDPEAEAGFVAAEIQRHHSLQKRPFKDVGILFRTAAQTRALEEALRLAGVPYRLVGAYAFYERKEVKDVLSYLRVVHNPSDTVSLRRILNFPQRAIGPKTVALLDDTATAARKSLWDIISAAELLPKLTAPQRTGLAALTKAINQARARHATNGSMVDTARFLMQLIGAREAWIRDPTEGPGGKQRWRNVEQLFDGIRAYQERKPEAGLHEYLRMIALEGRVDSADVGERDEVALLTMHAAKGLEWPLCFVVGCQEGLLPHARVIEDGGDVSEERRLFYVALTRARQRAYCSYSKIRRRYGGATERAKPSRFLAEIPAANRLDIDRAKGGGDVGKDEARKRFADLKARLAKGALT